MSQFISRQALAAGLHCAITCMMLFLCLTVCAVDEGQPASQVPTVGKQEEPGDVSRLDRAKLDSAPLTAMRELAGTCSFQITRDDARLALEIRKEPLLKYSDAAIAVASSTVSPPTP